MVSVCMATYNGAKYIEEQIRSIVLQLEEEDELIVSDDGSNDDTIGILESFRDKRIKIFSNIGAHGYVGNFNNALLKARGDIIFLSDQDDVWHDGKVKRACSYLQEYDIIVHDADIIDGEGIGKGYTYFSLMHQRTGFLSNLWKTRYLGCCMVFNRSVLDYCMPIPQNIVAHDYWIGMYGMTRFNVGFVPDVLMSYRRHSGNASPSAEKSDNSIIYKLFVKRFVLLYEIAKRMV